MDKKQSANRTFLILGFIAVGGLMRLLLTGAFPNFSPVAAMALFGGVYFLDRRLAFVLPLLVMFFTDLALEIAFQMGWREYAGFHASMPFVYLGFLATVVIGMFFRNNVKPLPLAGAGLLASTVFFLLSNFGVWLTEHYDKTLNGLMECYVMAIPFFHYTVAGTLFFILVFFGGFEYVKNRYFRTTVTA